MSNKEPLSQVWATSFVMLEATEPLTLTEIAKRVSKLTKKRASEASISARLRELKREENGDLRLVKTRQSGGSYLYEVVVPRANDEVLTPEGVVPASNLPKPKRPIEVYGMAQSNVEPVTAGVDVTKSGATVAGGRSALAYAESLRNQ